MSERPKAPGWYWFLPDERCPTPTGFLRIDMPVVVLVGQEHFTRHEDPPRLLVRFTRDALFVDDMSGDWAPIEAPAFMQGIARQRWKAPAPAEGEG